MEKENKKMGRPTDNPRTEKIGFRMSKKEIDMLNECSEILKQPRVDVVVSGVKKIYDEIKK
ncbi:hypothetical protein [Criibacterium bergeronii]|uniref:CopG family transcriptional regulator n=1 Tax=Criibacterium bergeronii TaxID=1871336 RepID=A0A371IIX7_9FIRM|nr:hypothetical protein [Criibacterium bergeronii]RDY20428.1 CopG family transcriptional regulator [Criibacterium bergeronii]